MNTFCRLVKQDVMARVSRPHCSMLWMNWWRTETLSFNHAMRVVVSVCKMLRNIEIKSFPNCLIPDSIRRWIMIPPTSFHQKILSYLEDAKKKEVGLLNLNLVFIFVSTLYDPLYILCPSTQDTHGPSWQPYCGADRFPVVSTIKLCWFLY